MNKRQYHKEMLAVLEQCKQRGVIPKLLLHSCCGPCSSSILGRLAPHFSIILYYDNPNIWPQSEFEKRFYEQEKVVQALDFPHGLVLEKGVYLPERYQQAVRGLEAYPEGSERCFACYRFRLSAAAERAIATRCDFFCTTLSVSPYKNADAINSIGEEIADEVGVRHLPNDFKKEGGYQWGNQFSKEHDIYRQHYCGCVYSYQAWQSHEQAKKEKEAAE